MTRDRDDAANPGGSGGARAKQSNKPADGNTAEDQRQRLLVYAQEHGSVDTLTARRELDILMPAARVFELRAMGYPLPLIWVRRQTDSGKVHRVGLYCWTGGPEGDASATGRDHLGMAQEHAC